MRSAEATLTSKGQITLPAALRRALGLRPGDRLVFAQAADGRVYIEARTETLASLRGIVGRDADPAPQPVTDDDVVRWIGEARGARWARGQGTG